MRSSAVLREQMFNSDMRLESLTRSLLHDDDDDDDDDDADDGADDGADIDADADERQRCVHVVKAAISITLADLMTALLTVTNILIIYLLYLLLVITIFLYAIILNPTKSKFLFLLIYDLLLF